jgi:hypothetical protein
MIGRDDEWFGWMRRMKIGRDGSGGTGRKRKKMGKEKGGQGIPDLP